MMKSAWWWRWQWRRCSDKVATAIAWQCPRWLVYRCSIRLGVYATTGQHSSQNVPELTFIDALQRWDRK